MSDGTNHSHSAPPPSRDPPDAVRCVVCGFAGSDLRIKGCVCAYHARCLDLVGLCRRRGDGGEREGAAVIASCPHCNGAARGLLILPLSFTEMDWAQRAASATGAGPEAEGAAGGGAARDEGGDCGDGASRKRSSRGAVAAPGCPAGRDAPPDPAVAQCYDPAVPRTGRWTDEELAFRDALIARFLAGTLPLNNGLRLNDFLSRMLRSKQSRLTKKLKHAKLSTKYFRVQNHGGPGCDGRGALSRDDARANKEFSLMERDFVDGVADLVERVRAALPRCCRTLCSLLPNLSV